MTVLGPNGVAVLDLRQARAQASARGWTLRKARYSYLTDGDQYDTRTWKARVAAGKQALTPTATTAVPAQRRHLLLRREP